MKSFIIKTIVHLAAMLLASLGFIAILLVLTSLFSTKQPVEIAPDSVLVMNLNTNIPDAPQQVDTWTAIIDYFSSGTNRSVHLKGIIDAIDRAAEDERISGLYLQGSLMPTDYGSGFASLNEIRVALLRFRQSGKPVTAYLTQPSLRDYYLATAADTVVLNPFGYLNFKGLVAKGIFFAKAFDQYGIQVQTLQAGKYKSAVDRFTRQDMSPEDREQTQMVIDNLWHTIVAGVARDRNLEEAALYTIAETHGILSPEQARDYGLVDEIAYFDAVSEDWIGLTSYNDTLQSFPQVALADYAYEAGLLVSPEAEPVIAVVYAEGDIIDGEGWESFIGGDSLARELRRLRRDDTVQALVLRINTPGGSAIASELIEREINLIRAAGKPVVISMGSLAASGGYWIAARADYIFAQPATLTGSIGIFGLVPNIQNLAAAIGITFDMVKTNTYADIDNIDRPKTQAELALLQQFVDQLYAIFINRVAQGRNLDIGEAEALAGGRVWTGEDALRLGLVDELGGLNDAISQARNLAGLDMKAPVLEIPEARPTQLLDIFFAHPRGRPPVVRWYSLPGKGLPLVKKIEAWLYALNDPRHSYARMPFTLSLE